MTKIQNENNKKKPAEFDLEIRTETFARDVRSLIKLIPKTIANMEDGKQVVRSSGSVGANYIEGNEALSKKDFLMRIRICRKEAKESRYWLKLIDIETGKEQLEKQRQRLIQESTELMNIFGAIIRKTELPQ